MSRRLVTFSFVVEGSEGGIIYEGGIEGGIGDTSRACSLFWKVRICNSKQKILQSAGRRGESMGTPSNCRYMILSKLNSTLVVAICISLINIVNGNASGLSSMS